MQTNAQTQPNKQMTVVQQNALSLREFLNRDNVKGTLAQALPKWLSVDRMLRIVFSSAMKNPKIMECSKESILQSVMQCAQLGLEPILGRAYLIPYNNRKYLDGRWTSVLECQMQPGYQGLVDLARRSGTIADVWGHNVYSNDYFSHGLGMDRHLEHKPFYLTPEGRKEGPGEIIGAYVVWQLKDGTKHPEFMPIYEIHKRRAKSQAYTFAETGDPKKGGGKKDSVWHVWPEEMNLKTVIKHSAKLVPSSIEFMQAVEIDDSIEGRGFNPMMPLDDMPSLIGMQTDDSEVTDAELAEAFDSEVAGKSPALKITKKELQTFVEEVAVSNGDLTIEEAKAEIMRSETLDAFLDAILKQKAKNTAAAKAEAKKKAAEKAAAQAAEKKPDVEPEAPEVSDTEWRVETAELQETYKEQQAQAILQAVEAIGIERGEKSLKTLHAEIKAELAAIDDASGMPADVAALDDGSGMPNEPPGFMDEESKF